MMIIIIHLSEIYCAYRKDIRRTEYLLAASTEY